MPARRFFILAAEKAIRQVSRLRSKNSSFEISLIFVIKREMRRLNRLYRGKNRPTDVLSFPRFAPGARPGRALQKLGRIVPMADPDGVIRLGEIVIAPEVARKEAAMFGNSVGKHYLFLFAHGSLHLLGYDHEKSKREEKEMFVLQRSIIEQITKNK